MPWPPRQTAGVTDEVRARKAILRTEVLAARADRGTAEQVLAGEAIAAHGLAMCRGASTVAAYVSFGTEPPTSRLLDGLRAAGSVVLLPVIDDGTLAWAAYAGVADLSPGPLGIPEPSGDRLPPTALADADLVVVPALAVDWAGHRLGRGGGFYDRALAEARAQVVAVVYDDELIHRVPHEPHDRLVDAVLRPEGVSRSRRR
jgi:5-formyltetrahydrofolate cyclo-ligase